MKKKHRNTQNMMHRPTQHKEIKYGGSKQWGHKLVTTILSNFNRLFKKLTGRFPGEFVVKCIFKIPPHLADVAT